MFVAQIDKVFQGFNTTIFAYGQTGSGKTFTIFGDRDNNQGIIPRSINLLFDRAQKATGLTIYCSFIQIYNEKIFDLLDDPFQQQALEIRQEPHGDGVFIGKK